MITLPSTPAVRSVTPRLIDFDLYQRPALGGPITHIQRPGARFGAAVEYPVMTYDTARVFISRLLQGRRDGLRATFSLVGSNQGTPGNPVVNSSVSSGTSLPVRSLTPGYVVEEGYWLNVVDNTGQHYLHTVAATATASVSGTATLTVYPALRTTLVSGNLVVLDAPVIEGIVVDPPQWTGPVDRLIALSFQIEEVE